MLKTQAIELLGGSVSSAAKAIGVTYQAVGKWPEVLTPAVRDRVQAALYRQHLESCQCTPHDDLLCAGRAPASAQDGR